MQGMQTAGLQRCATPFGQKALTCSRQSTPSSRLMTKAGFFGLGAPSKADITTNKQQLLQALEPVQRGLTASEEQQANIEQLIQQLERSNPNSKSLSAPEINGKWKLVYTTSQSILGTKRPSLLRPAGPIYQFIDAPNGKARNQESWPFFNSVYADLTPENKSKVAVQFTLFKILGLIPVKAPESAKGSLDTTFVDDSLRISRGDKGNVFVLSMEDPSGRP